MLKILGYFFILISLGYLGFTLYRIFFSPQLLDFYYYYSSLQFIIDHQSPYFNKEFVLNYPPSFLLLFLPFGVINYQLSQILWTLFSLGSLLGSIYLLLKGINKKVPLVIFLAILSLAIQSFPTKFTFGLGQINFVILLLLVLCFFLYQKGKFYSAGVILGVAASIKIFPLILVFFFLRKKCFSIPIIAGLSFVLLNLLAGLIFGSQLIEDYFTKIIFNLPLAQGVYYNQSLTGFLSRLGISSQLLLPINYTIFFVLLINSFFLTTAKKQSPKVELLEYSLFIVTILLAGGLAWQHYFVLLIIPFLILSNLFQKDSWKKSKLFLLLLLFSYFLISFNIKHPENLINISTLLLSHVFYGVILLYFIITKSLKKT